jgi:hypothetical protein
MNMVKWTSFVLFCVCLTNCTKKIEVEKIITKDNSDIRNVLFHYDSFKLRASPNPFLPKINDTTMFMPIDIDNDLSVDMHVAIRIFQADSHVYVRQFVKRLHANIEFLGHEDPMGTFLTAFTDTNNYISPGGDFWNSAFNKDEHLISTAVLLRCKINNQLDFCLIDRFGNFSVNLKNRYFFGFRIKNKKSSGNSIYWNYGYFKIQTSEMHVKLQKLSLEKVEDRPILLRE